GVHSAIAYLGAVAGRETIAEAMEIPGLQFAMRRFIAEDVAHSLVPPEGVSVVEYGEEVLVRFANPGIEYRSVQVATDGSQKLPPPAAPRRAAGDGPAPAGRAGRRPADRARAQRAGRRRPLHRPPRVAGDRPPRRGGDLHATAHPPAHRAGRPHRRLRPAAGKA